MTRDYQSKGLWVGAILLTPLFLSGCEEFNFPLPSPKTEAPSASVGTVAGEAEQPQVFSDQGPAVWDGRPTLGGIWVASTKTTELQRVRITHSASGRTVEGALFRIEPGTPGPELTLSSDAAKELAVVPGELTQISVVALRPTAAALPEATPETPAQPQTEISVSNIDGDATTGASDPSSGFAPLTTQVPKLRAGSTPRAATPTAASPPSQPAETPATAPGPILEIATFKDEAAADVALVRLASAGITAQKSRKRTLFGSSWIVFSGPLETPEDLIEARRAALQAGYEDAFVRTE